MILDVLLAALFAAAPAGAATPAPAPAAKSTPAPATAAQGLGVVLETSQGRIKIALHQDRTPATVANFLEYVRAGHYDGSIFHRVIPGFMIQGGGFDAGLKEKPTRPPVKNEARGGGRNLRGTVAMARTSDPHSASAQFFINLKDNHGLDFGISPDGWGYCVFGEVVEGLDVVDKIAQTPTMVRGPHEAVPRIPVVIKSAREVK
jgi:cyclophilin family peptidyl-prolyl cis-trans isomerase